MTFHTATSCATAGGVWDATANCCQGFNCPGDTINQAECTKIGKVWNPISHCCVGYNGCTAPPPPPETCPAGQVGTPPNCYPKPPDPDPGPYPHPRPRPRPGYPPHYPRPSYPRPRPRPYYPRYPSYRRFFRGRWWQWRMGRWYPYGYYVPRPRYGMYRPTRSYYASGGCSCS